MPVQTTEKSYVYFPDGAKVSVKAYGEMSYTDVGVITSAVKAVLQWKENQVETANAGKLDMQIKDMTIAGSFTLANLDPDNIARLSGGLITATTTAGTEVSTIPDQLIAGGWEDNVKYNLLPLTSSSDDTLLKLPLDEKPTFTSIKIATDTTPETLDEIGAGAAGDYMLVLDTESPSGWSIIFNSAGMTVSDPTTRVITIDWGANTPIASTTLWCGSSTFIMDAYALKITHTDAASKKRELEIFSVNPQSGGFEFTYKGASDNGVEEMPLSFIGKIDTGLTDGKQLMSWTVDTGAE